MLKIVRSVGRMHWRIEYNGRLVDVRPTRQEAKLALKQYEAYLGDIS